MISPWLGILLWPVLMAAASGPAAPLRLQVAVSRPAPGLTRMFQQKRGWTGGDVAYSIPLGPDRTLWLFGDTWIGKIEAGRRVGSRMVSNSAAWQSLRDRQAPLRFFWGGTTEKPTPLLRPSQPEAWYWPGDGIVVEGKLFLFCKVVRKKTEGRPGLQFDWFGNDLLMILNPQAEPTAWKSKRCRLPEGSDYPRLGAACLRQGKYLYVYGLFPARKCKPLDKPLALARIPLARLTALDMGAWEYWCRGTDGNRWSDRPANLVPLFGDAAPEMSVSRVRGIPGFVGTYTSLGLSRDILVRQAPSPEGPWGKPVRVYRCPETEGRLLLYGAKAHPELGDQEGQLFITYCRNLGALPDHVRRPEVYFPQGVEVRLQLGNRKE